MPAQVIVAVVVEALTVASLMSGSFFRPSIGPGMVWLRQPVLDAVLEQARLKI
jgi:hypothetical protein